MISTRLALVQMTQKGSHPPKKVQKRRIFEEKIGAAHGDRERAARGSRRRSHVSFIFLFFCVVQIGVWWGLSFGHFCSARFQGLFGSHFCSMIWRTIDADPRNYLVAFHPLKYLYFQGDFGLVRFLSCLFHFILFYSKLVLLIHLSLLIHCSSGAGFARKKKGGSKGFFRTGSSKSTLLLNLVW